MPSDNTVSLSTAITMLPAGDGYVHTFRNAGNMLVGTDWKRDEILNALALAPKIMLTGEVAQRMNHGIAIEYGGSLLFIATEPREAPDA